MRRRLEDMTKTERQHFGFATDALEMIEHDLMNRLWDRNGCPPEWHEIARDKDRRDSRRTRCTVAFDADVVKFFKALGPGYQVRMNRVLRAFMHMRLARVVHGPDTTDIVMRPAEVERAWRKRRPDWGDSFHFWDEHKREQYAEQLRDKWEAELAEDQRALAADRRRRGRAHGCI